MAEQVHTPPALLRLPLVSARTGLAKSTLYDLISRGLFPEPVALAGSRAVAWVDSEVNHWIEQQIANRSGRKAGERA